ncbi:16S rRNA (guanine(966)-N(2))-methyltransferase RsmD [Pleomorphomonas sp. NRK KF1]|uniref:16S rRNA (guanine(966)-N(2))-methyltransferase RsmD n=1 Tax=Pleomorphomonas sp. NRK KF1 TaxID=2943000 RepID=UPI002043B491|nr:16S rRNA (guanine(966)-N(2))-methyltransferase RsmD [Pleomorphomonas sp. NRK KF1]MCM5553060.1 16S rRNA (guanine(966)-N(2))-methyltransferase RsmD [Pleomorphomonas sp. NRK KF1]
MRIVAGKHRGAALATPASGSLAIRPTSDRLRESVFNILEHAYDGVLEDARVMDVFAGTGALGFEAMSRGAKTCLFVEEAAEARGLIRRNQEALGLMGTTRIFRRDATAMGSIGPAEPYGLVFLDPPYGKELAEKAIASLLAGGWLAEDALVIIEEAAKAEVTLPDGLERLDQRTYGETQVVFARRS